MVYAQLADMTVGEDKLNAAVELGDKVLAGTAAPSRETVRHQLAGARQKWNRLCEDVTEHCRRCREHADAVNALTKSLAQLNAWLDESQGRLSDAEKRAVETQDDRKYQLKTLQVS